MLSIGAFAQIARVTHRMLRHWDAADLLVPAHVDEFTGYRSYDPEQLERLHRIVALRQLGFGLDDISMLIAEGLDASRLTSLLRQRRADLAREQERAAARLVDVERRLHLIEKEKNMPTIEIVTKPLPAVRLAAETATVRDASEIPGIIGPVYSRIAAALGEEIAGREAVAQYGAGENGMHLVAGFAYDGDRHEGFERVDLPAADRAVCAVHLGAMDRIGETWQALHAEIVARGLVPSGPCRELYLRSEPHPQTDWVTELQQPVAQP